MADTIVATSMGEKAMLKLPITVFVITLNCLILLSVHGDVITLKDGKKVHGKIRAKSSDKVVIEYERGKYKPIPTADIDKIEEQPFEFDTTEPPKPQRIQPRSDKARARDDAADKKVPKPTDDKSSKTPEDKNVVDIDTFLKAHADGVADKYKGFTIEGSGMNCNGQADILTLACFTVSSKGRLKRVTSTKQWVDAQLKGIKLLRVVLEGNNIRSNKHRTKLGKIHAFSARFDGNYRDWSNAISVGAAEAPKSKTPVLVDCTVEY